MTTKAATHKFSPEVRGRAVRTVLERAGKQSTRWAAVASIAARIGCEAAGKLKALGRESRELRQAHEILRKASACFAQAKLDRPFKR